MRVRSLVAIGVCFLLIGLVFTYQRVLEHLNGAETAVERLIENKEFVWANFTSEERDWLSKNYEVHVGVDTRFFPIEGVDDNGNYTGVASDYLRILEKLTGLKFIISPSTEWTDILADIKSGKLDMLAALAPSPNRNQFLSFTQPYIAMPGIIVVQRGSNTNLTLEDLKGKNVAVVKRYVWHDFLEEYFKGINLNVVDDNLEGLQKVSFGISDAMVDFQFSITHQIKQSGIANLQVGGAIEARSGISMGVRKDNIVLRNILDKALQSITEEEHNAIAGKWLRAVEDSAIPDSAIAVMVAVSVSLMAATCFILLWNLALKRTVEQQTCELNQELEKRDRVEAALRKSEERYRRIFSNIQDVYFQFDMEGVIVEISPSVELIFETTQEETLGRIIAELFTPSIAADLRGILDRAGKVEDYSFVVERDDVPIHCSISGKFLTGRYGDPTGFVGSVRNVTTRVQYEEMLSKANLKLESRVEERTRDLQKMNEELQHSKEEADAATAAKSQFLTSISHELRTPLHAIIAFTEHVRSLESSSLVRKYLRNILDSSFTLLDIINDLLDFSKIEAGHVVVERVPFMLDHCVQRVCNLVLARAAAKELEFIVDLPPTVPARLLGDAGKLQQIILNLVSNALKFTPSGGTITLSFDYHVRKNDDIMLQCFVQDTGIGIPEDSLTQLFVPFQQLTGSDLHSYGGTGLGLSICRRFIEAMDGEIRAESEEGAGTLFAFAIPLVVQEGGLVQPAVQEELANKKALLVTKSVYSGQAMKRHFDFISVETEMAYGVDAAVAMVQEGAVVPDVICIGHNINDAEQPERLFDVHLPDKDTVDIPVVMLAAKNDKLSVATPSFPRHVRLFTEILTHRMLQNALCTIFDAEPLIPLDEDSISLSLYDRSVFKGVDVLVAEDTKTNRDILKLLLEPTGAVLTFATNGLEAVEAVRAKNSYDIILMDVQMPKMNGCDAASTIRNELGVTDIPIVALTAHAIRGSRQRMLQSGMEFFLTKPFGKDSLYSVMTAALTSPDFGGMCMTTNDTPSASLVLPSSIDSEVANRLGLAQEELDGLFKQFAREHGNSLSSMHSAHNEQNYAQLEQEAHALTGAASNVGASECAALAKRIEIHAGKLHHTGVPNNGGDNSSAVDELLATLEHELQFIVDEIHSMYPDSDGVEQEDTSPTVLDRDGYALVMELSSALELTNPLKIEELLTKVEPLLSSGDFSELEALVMDYEYDKACALLSQLHHVAACGGL
ncbi:MAG: transporter substrate-binding domain-containing protein [Desulfovibrionales bacterium]|nr:transporter substrate-binding domain-containing protein [Desulfovibrionales bacterium]